MKKGYNSTDIPQQEGQDHARRLYRLINDNARRLDDARGCARSVSDLFSPALLAQRSKLRENCERLIFLDPLLFGRKGEELLWRKVYYDVVSTSKRLKTQDFAPGEASHLLYHINAGLGYYHHFISKLQLEFHLNLLGSTDFPINLNGGLRNWGPKSGDSPEKISNLTDLMDWAELAVHRSLIYLGDLSRYKLEVNPNWDHGLAVRYYLQASSFKPQFGMPHNQLGTLANGLNSSLNAAYHYMRCLDCLHVFEGTENNLLRLFDKNRATLEGFSTEVNNVSSDPAEHIKRLISRFLLFIDILYFEKKSGHIPNLCHQILVDLQGCLSYAKPVASESGDSPVNSESFEPDTSPTYLSADSVFKMVVICLLCIIKLKKTESMQISAVKAFLLAVYSHLIQNVVEHIQGSVFNMSLPSPEPETAKNGVVKRNKKNRSSSKKSISKLRRRKLKNNSDDSDLSESELSVLSSSSSDSSDVSDATSPSTTDDESDKLEETILNGSSNLTQNGTLHEKTPKPSSVPEIEPSNPGSDPLKRAKRMDPMDLLEILADEGFLQSVKILCDWLKEDVFLLKECGKSSRILLKKIVQLFNLINVDAGSRKLRALKGNAEVFGAREKVPLPEDIILKGVSILKETQENLDWKCLSSCILDSKDEALLRVGKLVAFGHFLAGLKETGVSYDKKKKQFEVAEESSEVEDSFAVENDETSLEDSVSKSSDSISRGKLMKHMGQLWLAAEVQDLESRVQGRTAFSPYLVLDVDALIHYTHLAKQLVSARKFIVLVPIIVLSALDELKRETIKARDAIRWLEAQFHRGNRFLRAQRPQERAPIPLIKYPKKKDKETYTFIQIIECCHFLTQQQKGASNLVTLLTGNQGALCPVEGREISHLGLAQSAGVNLDLISSFHLKWKRSVKGNR